MLKKIARLVSFPVIFADFFAPSTGAQYGVGLATKLRLAYKMRRSRKRVQMGSSYSEHLSMATRVLNVPAAVKGCLVECGTWKGGSAIGLSLAADLTGRTLHIFDSFEGLPTPEVAAKPYASVGDDSGADYVKGDFCGQLDEVKTNLRNYGKIDRCVFHKGYFCDTLPGFSEPCVFAFLDVDLIESLHDCLQYLWPNLQPQCWLFTHEARDYNIASAFYDRLWWEQHLSTMPPGLIGAGGGLGLEPSAGGYVSDLGCAVKPA